jgi:hypothetical protein
LLACACFVITCFQVALTQKSQNKRLFWGGVELAGLACLDTILFTGKVLCDREMSEFPKKKPISDLYDFFKFFAWGRTAR